MVSKKETLAMLAIYWAGLEQCWDEGHQAPKEMPNPYFEMGKRALAVLSDDDIKTLQKTIEKVAEQVT